MRRKFKSIIFQFAGFLLILMSAWSFLGDVAFYKTDYVVYRLFVGTIHDRRSSFSIH